jgi:uncharacterized protein (TIGR03382 family)
VALRRCGAGGGEGGGAALALLALLLRRRLVRLVRLAESQPCAVGGGAKAAAPVPRRQSGGSDGRGTRQPEI